MQLSDYSEEIYVEFTDEELKNLQKIQDYFDTCMENSEKTKCQLLYDAIVGPKVY